MDVLIVSSALDTNGQNARYARASEKWGTDPGVLKALAVGDYDPASVVGRFQAAGDRYGELKIRSVHRSSHMYQSMPADIEWTRGNESYIKDLADEADIIHLNNSWRPWQKLRFHRRKPMLLHHHGSLFRSQTKDLLNWAYRNHAVQAVSTVDLMQPAPQNLHWLPTAYDVDSLQKIGKGHRREANDRILVVSAPTNRDFKSTEALEAAVQRLQADGLPVDLLVIEGRPWAECLALKATADIYFDQVKLGYGCNAVEAWGMGIPVIAGADEWTLAKMREVYATDLPFYEATEDTIGAAIADLATHKAKRTAYARRGLAHVRKFHDERPALTRLAQLYHMAIEWAENEAPQIPAIPITFRAAVPQVRAAGRFVTFDPTYTTEDAHMVTALRLTAKRYPRYGIEEVA